MDSKQLKKYGVGCLIADSIIFIEMFNDLRTGRHTWIEYLLIILFSMLSAALLVKFIRLQRAKERERRKFTKTSEENNTDSAEECDGDGGVSLSQGIEEHPD